MLSIHRNRKYVNPMEDIMEEDEEEEGIEDETECKSTCCCCCEARVLAPYFDDSSSISTDRSSCLSWDDESEDDSSSQVEDEFEIVCEQEYYAPDRRRHDVKTIETALVQYHPSDDPDTLELLAIVAVLKQIHMRMYDEKCLVTEHPIYVKLELVYAASAVERIQRSLPATVPLDSIHLLLHMIASTWIDVESLYHFGKSGQMYYAIL
ncbi:unnamed protein product [Aphanomyces euteiches]|uniref:Uncharacterized protein n=1 Tax=Aphanomyces euteiches TaxID=100861 RepID=A0A6G0WZK9_9STRA|nr:hypothetical protein Ae201684_009867 [Aphanomyces euteiches]KAH9095912.1 hypothetical protein Ae201684P_010122 [Aphanomyces euteiches]